MNSTAKIILRPQLFQPPFPPPLIRPHFPRLFQTLSPIRSSSTNEPPPETVEIKFRRGSRRRRNLEEQPISGEAATKKVAEKKSWEEMSVSEKAIELYMGEKGFLFWVNKFAYASIFIIIGAWILFRFVGPAFNLYQLDTPPLSPEAVFKG